MSGWQAWRAGKKRRDARNGLITHIAWVQPQKLRDYDSERSPSMPGGIWMNLKRLASQHVDPFLIKRVAARIAQSDIMRTRP